MNPIVVYQSKYGSTKRYAEWIGEALGCPVVERKSVSVEDLMAYDTIIYGGGLYAEMIAGITLITKNFEKLKEKQLVVFTTGLTPTDCTEYYENLVVNKNFTPEMQEKIKRFHFLGKMILKELSLPHRTAISALKKIMAAKKAPTEMEKLLLELCDYDGDFTDKNAILPLLEAIR